MLFRHRTPPPTVATRFRADAAVFSTSIERGLHVVGIAAGMARSIELLHALARQMPPVVDFSVECLRSQRRFVGDGLSLSEVRETIARLTVPLLSSGAGGAWRATSSPARPTSWRPWRRPPSD